MVCVLDRLDVEPGPCLVHTPLGSWNESPAHDLGQLFQQHRPCRAGVYTPAPCGEADGHAGLDVSGLDDHRGAWQDYLGGPLYLDPSAPARAPVSAHDASYLPLDAPGEEVFEGDPAYRVFEERRIERVHFGSDSDQGRRGERVPLHPIYVKGERSEIMRAGEAFVGPVSLAVYAVKCRTQALHRTRLYSVLVPAPGPLFFDLLLGLFPRDHLVFPRFEFCFCLILGLSCEYVFQFLQLLEQALVLFDWQDNAYALTVLDYHVLCTHLHTSLPSSRLSQDLPLV